MKKNILYAIFVFILLSIAFRFFIDKKSITYPVTPFDKTKIIPAEVYTPKPQVPCPNGDCKG